MKNVLLFIITGGLWGLHLAYKKWGVKSLVVTFFVILLLSIVGKLEKPQAVQQAVEEVQQPTLKVNKNKSYAYYNNGMAILVDWNAKDLYGKVVMESLVLVPTNGEVIPVSYQKTDNCTKGEAIQVSFRMGGKNDYVQGLRTCIEDNIVTYEPLTLEGVTMVMDRVKNKQRICTEAKEYGDYNCIWEVADTEIKYFYGTVLDKVYKTAKQKQQAL